MSRLVLLVQLMVTSDFVVAQNDNCIAAAVVVVVAVVVAVVISIEWLNAILIHDFLYGGGDGPSDLVFFFNGLNLKEKIYHIT